MNNKVTFAAAGNGKTYNICKHAIAIAANTNKNVLIVTYTREGIKAIETEYKKQNNGVIDKNIRIKTWYNFVLAELIKPYQCLLQLKYKHFKNEFNFEIPENYISTIAFYDNQPIPKWYKAQHIQYYINSSQDIRTDNVSNLACLCIKQTNGKVISRLEEIYSYIFFDELQDYAGYDLDIFLHLFSSNISITCVGDYKQATFRTNNSRKNSKFRDANIKFFFIDQEKKGLCKIHYDKTTRRFNQEICNFVNLIHNDTDNLIFPSPDYSNFDTESIGVYLLKEKDLAKYCAYFSPVILRYNVKSKISFSHQCNIFNYGASKGATFDRVIIIPTKAIASFIETQTPISSMQTRAKFFVACTRARHSIAFIDNGSTILDHYKPIKLSLGNDFIDVYKFMSPT